MDTIKQQYPCYKKTAVKKTSSCEKLHMVLLVCEY